MPTTLPASEVTLLRIRPELERDVFDVPGRFHFGLGVPKINRLPLQVDEDDPPVRGGQDATD